MAEGQYAARIRWQAAAHPGWELETHHPGFATAEDAALFANGLADAGVAGLELAAGEIWLELTDGSRAMLPPAAATVWTLGDPADTARVAIDADFLRIALAPAELTARGLDGGFVPLGYAVLGPGGEPLDVAIALDRDLGTLDVSVDGPDLEGAPRAGAGLLFGVIPRA